MLEYAYAPEACDISDDQRDKLLSFRERRSLWHEWLISDEASIWNQIHTMLWNDAVFWSINEMRRIAYEEKDDRVGINPEVANFIDQGYATTQLLAIRKLTDPSKDALSLPRILSDMKTNAELFTREIYVCNDGLSFDANQVNPTEDIPPFTEGSPVVFRRLQTGGPNDAFMSQQSHLAFDRLPRLSTSTQRNEVVDPKVFDALRSKLGVCANVSKVASKFIAHAADSQSRDRLPENERRITFERIRVCHRTIVRVASAIRGPLLDFSSPDLYPTPQYDHLEKIDLPLVRPENIEAISDFWDEHQRKNELWLEGGWEALTSQMT